MFQEFRLSAEALMWETLNPEILRLMIQILQLPHDQEYTIIPIV